MSEENTLKTSFGKLELNRYPLIKNDNLKAWDSSDELILEHISTLELTNKKILIINDSFGALGLSLSKFNPTIYTDSFISFKSTKENNKNSELDIINNIQEVKGQFDFALIKLPKNMSYFEDILCHLTKLLKDNGQIIYSGMIKHMAPSAFDLINKYIGKTSTSLAKKKARLIFSSFTNGKVQSPYPKEIEIKEFTKPLTNHSNVFSREGLDIGSRFFLENIPANDYTNILDLGCGNGIIGIKAKLLNPNAKITFTDESFMAIKSATENYSKFFDDAATYHWTNSFEEGAKQSFDLILCNPPFHQNNTIGDFIAWQMFKDSLRVLKKGGKIIVIGNHHLVYNHKLKKFFGNYEIIKKNKKFMIVQSTKD